MAKLKLHRDESNDQPHGNSDEAPTRFRSPGEGWTPRIDGRPADDDSIRGAEAALDRIDRAMANLRELMGENFEGPDGPRAA